ncbi:glucose-6-phosphate dehydrogenase [bacterium AH-315-J19]|nr:glucose-6-phosphate dehydrogenase [Robiginitomaculum sp.]MBN4058530.1 glucose-6-phosphate dehydrogenase [bacterium AH-315-J19]
MAEFIPVEPFDIVIFGGTGDLSRRKLLPALFHRFLDGQLDHTNKIIGAARTNFDRKAFVKMAKKACFATPDEIPESKWAEFAALLDYIIMDATDKTANWNGLKTRLNQDGRPVIYYMATTPHIYVQTCQGLGKAGLNTPNARLVLEKPIGTDLTSARLINDGVGAVFPENSIFRIDHYLGKETVQNLMVLRFANTLFEPLWSHHYIDHVQITVAENIGVEGRAGYYDRSGAVRDMVQNHLLQLLCLTAMEPPNSLIADEVRTEKIKVLKALKAFAPGTVKSNTVRAQYSAGMDGEIPVRAYLDTLLDTTNADDTKSSRTETFVAIKTEIKNWRWAGVPFYLRTGKRMASRHSEIVIQFKPTPHPLFEGAYSEANRLVIRLQPDEGVKLYMQIKEPGPGGLRIKSLPLNLSYAENFSVRYPDAYERLLMDIVRGNLALFMRRDEVEAAWTWVDNLLANWEDSDQAMETYAAGTQGPVQSAMLMDRDGRTWWESNYK